MRFDHVIPSPSRFLQGYRLYLLLGLFHLLLAMVFTYPLVLHAEDQTVIADTSGDEYQTMWFFWWMKKALLALQNPYWTNDIYYPGGTGLAYHLSPSTNLMALTVSGLTGAPINSPLVFNVLVFGTFVLIGLASFALIRHVSGSALAAFLGSTLIAVSPYRMLHLNHLNLLSMGWGILSLYFVVRMIEQPRIRYAVLAAICFAVLYYASLSDALMLAMLLVVFTLLSSRAILRHAARGAVIRTGAAAVALSCLMTLPGILQLRSTGSEWETSTRDLTVYSADPGYFVLPLSGPARAAHASALGQLAAWGPPGATSGQSEAFLGWGLGIASLMTLITTRSRPKWKWLVLTIVFLVLALGPTLRLWGSLHFVGRMPYEWLRESVPFLELSRTPLRFASLAHLCLTVFASIGMASWCQSIGDRLRMTTARAVLAAAAVVLVAGVAFFEARPLRIELWRAVTHDIYPTMAADSSIRAVLELPIKRPNHFHNRYMYWQTVHGHKLVNGYLTHPSPNADSLLAVIKTWGEVNEAERAFLLSRNINVMVMHAPEGIEDRVTVHRLD